MKALFTTVGGWCIIFGFLVSLLFLNAAVRVFNPEWGQYSDSILENAVTASRVDRCVTCHNDLSTHPGSFTVDHLPDRFGCTLCHGGVGRAVTAREAHAAGREEIALRTGKDIQSSCLACHTDQFTLDSADVLNDGKRLIYEKRCIRCHQISSFSAAYPGLESFYRAGDLGKLAAGMPPEWLFRYLKNPHQIAARTGMPFFGFNDDEVRSIVSYLVSKKKGGFRNPEDAARVSAASANTGRQLVKTLGCLGCHAIEGKGNPKELDGSLDLSYMGSFFAPDFLVSYLRPETSGHQSPIPLFENEVFDLVAYLSSLKAPKEKEYDVALGGPELAERGRRLIAEFNCYGCHTISGFENMPPSLPELSTIGDRFVEDLGAARSLKEYLIQRIKAPKQQDPESKMPVLAVSDAEAEAIAIALMGLKAGAAPPHLAPELRGTQEILQAADRMAIHQFRCASCHHLPWRTSAPAPQVKGPDLEETARHLTLAQLAAKLSQPYPARLNVARMPLYKLDDQDVLTLIRAIRLR